MRSQHGGSSDARTVWEMLRSLQEELRAEAALVQGTKEQGLDDLRQDLDLALVQTKSASLAAIDAAPERLEAGGPRF